MQTRWISCVSWYSRDVLHLSPLHANKKGLKSRMNHSTMSDLKSMITGATLNLPLIVGFRHPKCKDDKCEYVHLPLGAEGDPELKRSKVEENKSNSLKNSFSQSH